MLETAPNSIEARDVAYLLHPYTPLRAHESKGPLVVASGEGAWVTDTDGKRYLEGLAGLWCAALGFGETRLAEAAAKQMRELPYMHLFAHRSHVPAIELAERLVKMAPGPKIEKAFFVNSGSEAIDSALKIIWYFNNARGRPEKKKIIVRKRAYHGVTLAGGHCTALPYARNGFDLPMADRFLQVTTPSHYRDGAPEENEDAFATRLADELDALIEAEGPETVAAFFAEPVQGAGGVIVPPASYFEKIQRVLAKHDVLLLADEVITGFGRTGEMWGSNTFSIEPDLVTCAKGLSSAYAPIGAVLMSGEIHDALAEQSEALGTFGMGYTYSGHPAAAAVALETLKIYEEMDIAGVVAAKAPGFRRRLETLEAKPLVGEARGVGMLGGIEIVQDRETRAQFDPAKKAAPAVVAACLERGLILRALPGDVIGICPPLIATEDDLDFLFAKLGEALDACEASLRAA